MLLSVLWLRVSCLRPLVLWATCVQCGISVVSLSPSIVECRLCQGPVLCDWGWLFCPSTTQRRLSMSPSQPGVSWRRKGGVGGREWRVALGLVVKVCVFEEGKGWSNHSYLTQCVVWTLDCFVLSIICVPLLSLHSVFFFPFLPSPPLPPPLPSPPIPRQPLWYPGRHWFH